ncbi:MAG: AAA family ATPase [Promethearchaeota archaeon]
MVNQFKNVSAFNELKTIIKAGAPLIEVISYEIQRVHGIINSIAKELNREWYRWSQIKGLEKWNRDDNDFQEINSDIKQPDAILDTFNEFNKPSILILEDFHPFMNSENHSEIVRRLREISFIKKEFKKTLILAQPIKVIPIELIKELPIVEIELPDRVVLKIIFDDVVKSYNLEPSEVEESDKLIDAALGLTTMEARLAFSKAIVDSGKLTEESIQYIIKEKENIIKKKELLEYFHPENNLDTVGGLDILKDWLKRRGKAFGRGAKDFGLDTPRGVLLLGVPGCGKSLCAKAIANVWNFPLLRFDLGKVYAGVVGQTEQNIRNALDIAKALAPCILWIDEIEKGLSGVQSSNQTDSGVSARVFGTFLTWMQEKTEPVFVVATANDISQLPPELLRKGRFDEIFFVDLPSQEEREEIFKIHLKKKKRNPENFQIKKLAQKTKGFTGAEIEEVIKEGLFRAFDKNEDLKDNHIISAIEETNPLSKTMGKIIAELRKWAKFKAKMASSIKSDITFSEKDLEETDKIPKLKQELNNPFL